MNRSLIAMLVVALVGIESPVTCDAANPDQIAAGRNLFMQDFVSTLPGENGDGLGPVFNDTSCVACHHQGGVGGSGGVRHNARSVGMSSAVFDQSASQGRIEDAMANFSPGFVSGRTILSSFPLHRRGGSSKLAELRNHSMTPFNPEWDDPAMLSPDTVHAERNSRVVRNENGNLQLTTHVFNRNTTPLFGTGWIDQLSDEVLWNQVKRQQGNAEVSGRPATFEDGRIGKFGWRANFATLIEFTENACANELGLQSKRVQQQGDFTRPDYRSLNPDLSDEAIFAMNAFIASLPRPVRDLPSTQTHREQVDRGEQRFATVGCAVCHPRQLGHINDFYSDMLLHDMGEKAMDLAGASPYLKKSRVSEKVEDYDPNSEVDRSRAFELPGAYYGIVTPMSVATAESLQDKNFTITSPTTSNSSGSGSRGRIMITAPTRSPSQITRTLSDETGSVNTIQMGKPGQSANRRSRANVRVRTQVVFEVEPTNVNQEWKTPPLWGLRDSAPYMHDGRAETILEAIAMHDGEGRGSRDRFFKLSFHDQQALLAFLNTFVAPRVGVTATAKQVTRRDAWD